MIEADSALWLRRVHGLAVTEGSPRILVLPHAGGSATSFRELSIELAPDFDVVAVQYPGRQDRRKEPHAASIQELAADLLEHVGFEPVVLFGHSMGAIVAFELAVLMESTGRPPVRFYASASRAPSRVVDHGVHLLDDDGLIGHLGALSGTDERVFADEEMRRTLLHAVRGDYRILETYRATSAAALSCPVHVLVGLDDLAATVDDGAEWSVHSAQSLDMRTFSGGHFFPEKCGAAIASMIRNDQRRSGVWLDFPREWC